MERIYSVLVVSAGEKFHTSMRDILPESIFDPVCSAGSTAEARRALADRDFDIIIINTPLPDDFGRRLAVDICLNGRSVVMLLVRGEVYDDTCVKVTDYGVLTMRKPSPVAMISQALDWMRAMRERLRGFEKKTATLEEKMAEIRIVNRAKWALIESCKMTESDAHRYIEKQAMDRCVSRREIAEKVLQTYK